MIGYVKQTPLTSTTSDFNKLFQTYNSSQNSNSYLTCMHYSVNKSYFTIVYDRKYKLGSEFYINSLASPDGLANNDFKLAHFLNINFTERIIIQKVG